MKFLKHCTPLLTLFFIQHIFCAQTKDIDTFFAHQINQQVIYSPEKESEQCNNSFLRTLCDESLDHFLEKLNQHWLVKKNYCESSDCVFPLFQKLDKQKKLIKNLCSQSPDVTYALAHKLVALCFGKQAPRFVSMHTDIHEYHNLELLYTTIWSTLCEHGWCNWSQECLEQLKADYDAGKEIVYLAGGTDIYQLLKHGIYSFTVVDPFLPDQERYYNDDYEWLLHGEDGDTLECNFPNKRIALKRKQSSTCTQTFCTTLKDGQLCMRSKLTSVWMVVDENNNELGTVTFKRRLCEQQDFKNTQNSSILMSFNELFYLAAPSCLGGWCIDYKLFDTKQAIYIKQLSFPFTQEMIKNLRLSILLNLSDFHFIALGSDIG